jgi:hypothetical protein
MVRTDKPTGVQAYYDALQKIFRLQSEILTGAIPHRGERGRNDEERLRDFLSKVLPRKLTSELASWSAPTLRSLQAAKQMS